MKIYIKIRPKPASRPRVTTSGTYNEKAYTKYKSDIQKAAGRAADNADRFLFQDSEKLDEKAEG